MCGRYYRKSDKQKIVEHFRVRNDLTSIVLPDADYNVAPTTMQPVIREARDTNARELVLMRWGLIPFFTKALSEVKGISTINARAETIATSGTYREPFKRRRCIIPANGFYEWALSPIAADSDRAEIEAEEEAAVLQLEPKRVHKPKSSGKTPYRFDLANGQPFAFAGLWDAWKEPKRLPQDIDHWLQSFTIITTEPNELTAQVHTRMPVILRPIDYDRWLSREVTDQPPLDLLRPYPAEEMEMHPASPAVGNVRNNGPELLDGA
jgi:putative SOS response-associated peptidase YedK